MRSAKTGQSWSIDLIIGVIIFMLIIAIFYAFLGSKNEDSATVLQDDARAASAKMSGDGSMGIIKDGVIDEVALQALCDKPYEEVKAELGVENDICIYIEDQNGNLIPCGTMTKAGIGNGEDVQLTQTVKCGGALP